MTPRASGRTQPCEEADARVRLAHAQKFLEVADLAASETGVAESASVAAALAVLAGIAASDASCCRALGRRSRSQNHLDAAKLLEDIEPGGPAAATTLRRLLGLKDAAEYGLANVGGTDLRSALRRAAELVRFADDVVRG